MEFKNRDPSFYVWEKRSGYTRKRHRDIKSAEEEAQKLAKAFPAVRFHIFVDLGYYKERKRTVPIPYEKKKPVDQEEQRA